VTGFWIIRHALVDEAWRSVLYGTMDVGLCEQTVVDQRPLYHALAGTLPRKASWIITPLKRTRQTAEAIQRAGYGDVPMQVEPELIEQNMGAWTGLSHDQLPSKLQHPKHPFWPLAAHERPPGGESMNEVITRVGGAMDRLATVHAHEDVVIVSHGGSIRAAVAHAIRVSGDNALHPSVQNVSLTRMERLPEGWRVVAVNQMVV